MLREVDLGLALLPKRDASKALCSASAFSHRGYSLKKKKKTQYHLNNLAYVQSLRGHPTQDYCFTALAKRYLNIFKPILNHSSAWFPSALIEVDLIKRPHHEAHYQQ